MAVLKKLDIGISVETLEKEIEEALAGVDLEQIQLPQEVEGSEMGFEQNDIVKGTIIQVNADEVIVDIGYKSEGYIPGPPGRRS